MCAKIVNSDWDLLVRVRRVRSDSLGGILLLEKEINQKGMMPLSHSTEKNDSAK